MFDYTDGSDLALTVIGSFLFWLDLYGIVCLFQQHRSPEWNCRIITAVHGFITAALSLTSSFILGPWPFYCIGKSSNALHDTVIIISVGYFLFDFTWCIYMRTEGPLMLVHHMISLFGLFLVLHQAKYACELSAVTGASEVTNPLLQLRWFMKETNHYSGMKAVLVDWIFLILFAVFRIGIGTPFVLAILASPDTDYFAKYGSVGFHVVNVVFGMHIFRYMWRKYMFARNKKPH